MKTRVWLVFVVLLSLIAAQPRLPAGALQSPPEPGAEYLLSLPVPSTLPDVPANLMPEGVAAYARRLLLQQAEPLLSRLQQLRDERIVVGFEVHPDVHGVAVQLAKGAQPHELDALPGVSAVMPAADVLGCAQGTGQALQQQLLAASQAAAIRDQQTRGAASAEATNPSINVYLDPNGSSGSVWGYTDADTTVNLTIYRADGTVRTTQSTTSGGSGHYYFSPRYHSCPVSGYDWVPHAGDRVQVTAAGNTVSTTVVSGSLWADPVADTVSGETAAGRTVDVDLYYYPSGLCYTYSTRRTTTSGSDGAFTANFGDSIDFDGTSYAYAYVRDANGNTTCFNVWAYSLRTSLDSSNYVYGYLKPNLPFSATLNRGTTPIDTFSGIAGPDNYFSGSFSEAIQAGDVIEVTGDGVTVSLTAAPLTGLVLDPATDSVSGTTSPGRTLVGYFYKQPYYPSYNGCSDYGYCVDGTADGSGHFTLQAGLDWAAGDTVSLYVFDAAGNYQYMDYRYAPLIMARPGSGFVQGTWPERYVEVAASLSREGSPISTCTGWVSSGIYDLYFLPYPEPGDVIEVTDGTTTASMTVQEVTARVDSQSDLVYGQAPAAPATVRLTHLRRDSGWYSYCQEVNLPGDSYSVDHGIDLIGTDYANIHVRGSDGHKSHAWGHAFWVQAYIDEHYGYGYTVEPSTGVHAELRDNADSLKGSSNPISDPYDGSYGMFFSPLSTIVPGDSLEVTTDDSWDATLEISELTAELDEVSNRIYGQAPPSQPVQAYFVRYYNQGAYSHGFTAWADAAGNYSVPLDGYYWWRDCSPYDAGGRCTLARAYYYDRAGHAVFRPEDKPPPVEADLFEDDDTHTSATPYEDVQSHSFHDYPDYDWVLFNVPPEDVVQAIPYRFETFHLGWGMATRARLYESDGTTLVWEETAYENQGNGLERWWTPTSAGDYYLQLSPPDYEYSTYCDAVYDLRIFPLRGQVFLPLIKRNN